MRNAIELINPSAPAGKSQQYAKPERERRFLLREVPDGEITKSVEITDRYFSGTRLRLRQMSEKADDTTRSYYKLTQKNTCAGWQSGSSFDTLSERARVRLVFSSSGHAVA